MSSIAYDGLRPAALRQLNTSEFEELCEELLRLEARIRGVAPVFRRSSEFNADGGRDIGWEIPDGQPLGAGVDSPIADADVSEICFSCKSGGNIRQLIMRDLSRDLSLQREYLARGGRLTILLREERPSPPRPAAATKKRGAGKTSSKKGAKTAKKGTKKVPRTPELEDEIVDALVESGFGTKKTLRARVRVIAASDIVAWLRRHQPAGLRADLGDKLGITPVPGLLRVAAWRLSHEDDRGPVRFVDDPERSGWVQQLRTLVASPRGPANQRIVWIVGPPGAGKSRLVLEALRGDSRAMVAEYVDEATRALTEGRLLDRYADPVLVVDDLPAGRLEELQALFVHHARLRSPDTLTSACLVAISPADPVNLPPRAGSPLAEIRIEPRRTDLAARKALVQQEIGRDVDDSVVARVVELTEGYPWYEILVARGAREHADVLPLLGDSWRAAQLALAQRREYASDADWETAAKNHARLLFLVMLTEALDWDVEIPMSELDDLCEMVGISHTQLQSLADKCDKRGLLRRRAGWKFKYVSPHVLGREVAAHFLAAPGMCERLLARARRFLVAFVRRIRLLGVTGAAVTRLSEAIADSIDGPPSLEEMDSAGAADLWAYAAEALPMRIAVILHQKVAASSDHARRRADLRRPLVWTLESLAHRRGTFDIVESALLALALCEIETYANNATSIWASLFGLHPVTHVRLSARMARLEERSQDDSASVREAVARAIETLLSPYALVTVDATKVDGEPPAPTAVEFDDAVSTLWRILAALSIDEDPAVRAAAASTIRRSLRSGLDEWGNIISQSLMQPIAAWAPEARSDLAAVLDEVRAYDLAGMSERGKSAYRALSQSTAPSSYRERFRKEVGHWPPAADLAESAVKDDSLVREGLCRNKSFEEELDWLASPAAARRRAVMIAAGRVDDGSLLSKLVERTRGGAPADLLAAYLWGRAQIDESFVDHTIEQLIGDAQLSAVLLLVLGNLPPSTSRTNRLLTLIPKLDDGALALGTTLHRWASLVSADDVASVVRGFNAHAPEGPAIGLDLVFAAIREAKSDDLLDVAEETLNSVARNGSEIAGHLAWEWEQVCQRVADAGRADNIATVAVRMLDAPESDRSIDGPAWTALLAAAKADGHATWERARRLLDPKERKASARAITMRYRGISDHFAPDDVLDWVGDDTRRAAVAAHLVWVHAPQLHPIARGILARFGASGPPAETLAATAASTPRAVHSLAQFAEQQRQNAQQWGTDADARVSAWAREVMARQQRSAEWHDAREQHRREVG